MKAELDLQKAHAKGRPFLNGMKSGTVIALGYIPIAITFGLLSKSAGVDSTAAMMMSLFVFAGASQFVGINLLSLGVSHWEIVATTFLINFRHFLMSSSISQKIHNGTSRGKLLAIAFGITDETFTVASLREEAELPPSFILGLNFVAYAAWNIGTWAGLFLASGLSPVLQNSMGIALYAMFIGLLVPSLRKSYRLLIIVLISAGISLALHGIPLFHHLSAGWIIIIATLTASTLGAWLLPKGDEAS